MNRDSIRNLRAACICVVGTLLVGSLLPSSAHGQYDGYAGSDDIEIDPTFAEADPRMTDRFFRDMIKGYMGVVQVDPDTLYIRLGDWNQCEIPQEFALYTQTLEPHHKMWTVTGVNAKDHAAPYWHTGDIRGPHPKLHPYEFKILFFARNDIQPSDGHDLKLATFHPNNNSGVDRLQFDVTYLTNTPEFDEQHPCWSPNGQFVAFSVERDWADPGGPDDPGGIYIMKADGTGRTRISDLDGVFLDWSRDGTRIAFSHLTYEPYEDWWPGPGSYEGPDHGTYDLYVVNTNGGPTRRLTDTIMADEFRPSWHPYEDIITYERQDLPYRPDGTHADSGLPIYRESGRLKSRIRIVLGETFHLQVTPDFPDWYTGDVQMDDNPQFTPSGHHIVFRSDRLGNGTEIVRLRVSGGSMESVGKVSDGPFHVNWNFTDYGAGCGGFESVDISPPDSFSKQSQAAR